jgi:uncharacterized protein (DUF58 family)
MSDPARPVPTAQHGALAAAARWRLPFARQTWRGPVGSWLGAGAGSSLDFQDHRAYAPGDDPRHIHWQAYARTGALTMKLYRAEVSPSVEILVDVSASMTFTPDKALRADELLAFAVASADHTAAPVRVHAVSGHTLQALDLADVRSGRWRERLRPAAPGHETSLPAAVPWRPGALKVFISDLLFPGDPGPFVAGLAVGSGLGILLVPTVAAEGDLTWRGNCELTDCETGAMRRQRIDDGVAANYRAAYARHFHLWREACQRRNVIFARVPCEQPLPLALGGEALAVGAVESVL